MNNEQNEKMELNLEDLDAVSGGKIIHQGEFELETKGDHVDTYHIPCMCKMTYDKKTKSATCPKCGATYQFRVR